MARTLRRAPIRRFAAPAALSFTYDLAGRQLSETSAANGARVGYTYDPVGNRLSLLLNGTPQAQYAYDDAGRLMAISSPWTAQPFAFRYDAAGRRTRLQSPGGARTVYQYDSEGRLKAMKTLHSWTTPITHAGYDYDPAGNRTSKVSENGKEAYGYDVLDRLVSVFRNGALSEAYGYDPVGNRTSSLDLPSWIYNERNELLSNGAASFTYDAAGNLATKTEAGTTWSYEWNAENQLTRVTKNGAEVARFSYDPLGRRIAITPGPAGSGPASRFVYDGEDMLRVVSREGKSLSARSFVHGPGIDEPLAYADTGQRGLGFFHADALGSIVKTSDAAGAVTGTLRYEAFGALVSGAPRTFGFIGREYDSDTGLLFLRNRYLDVKTGRFLSGDPIGTMGGVNFYTYVDNNAPNLTDPDGLVVAPRRPFPIPPPTGSTSVIRWWAYYMALDCWENPDVLPMIGPGVVIPGGKAGTAFGARAFRKMTRKGKRIIIEENRARFNGITQCERCDIRTQPPAKHQPGITPPGSEHHVDHIIERQLGGNGDPSNGQLLCRTCNLKRE